MYNAGAVFNAGIAEARDLTALFNYLADNVKGPFSYDDLLRSQIVYSLSAFDKLMHDIIRIGMVACYSGARPMTDKYQAEPISLQLHGALVSATVPPKEFVFQTEVVVKLSRLTFQDPEKVAEGLSLIWGEKNKWVKIAGVMGKTVDDARTTLKLIVGRRNAIVHESDRNPLTNVKTAITAPEVKAVTDFLELCGNTIVGLVA
ncbi:HEPN domain-containing protein [Mesorhizobium sp. M0208]|uniref:HEPN domain-containing protein n=1 Tax=Mesorhizobium sp. M0208 TaxID=2956916 RepID=UPI00333D70D1